MLTKRPFRVFIVFLVLSVIGVAVIPGLNVSYIPNEIRAPSLTINYRLSDSSPDIVERLATSPIENAMSQIKGVNRVYSVSRYNQGQVQLDFDKGEDMAFRKFEVNSIIRNIYKKLPEGLSYPVVEQSGGTEQREPDSPILTYSVNGPYAPYKLQKDVDEYIGKTLSQINDIKQVQVNGANPLQLTIDFDLHKLTRYQLNKSEIARALSSNSEPVFAGMASTASDQRFFLRTQGQLPDLSTIENMVVAQIDGKSLFLKDVATVSLEESQPRRYSRINGQNAIYVNIYAREGVNKIVLASDIRETIARLAERLPEGVILRLERDDTEYLAKEMDKIYLRTGLSVLILVLFILAINRNPRYLLVLFLGIITNLCLTAIIVYSLGVELHMFSIAGVTISFGLIVDNAIVMLDHLHRKRNSRIFLALLAASLTTIMALLMVLLLPEDERKSLTDFSVVVAINLGVSLVIALFFTPALYSLLFKEKLKRRSISIRGLRRRVRLFRAYLSTIGFIVRFRKTFITLVIIGFGLPVFMLPLQWEGQDWYNDTIGSDKYQDEIRPITDKILGGALRKFMTEVYEGYSYRNPQQTKLIVNAKLPFGTTLDDANFVIGKVEEYLVQIEGIDKFVASVGPRRGSISITFKPEYELSALPYQLKARLQARSLDLTGVQWDIYGVGRSFNAGGQQGSTPSYRVSMKGYNFDELEKQAGIMAEKLSENRRVENIKTNAQISWGSERTSEYVLDFNVERLVSAGINRGDAMNMLDDLTLPRRASLNANYGDERLPVFIKASNASEFSTYDLMEEALPLDTNRFIKIKDYASLVFEESANEIHKEDRQYIRIVAFDYLGSYKFGNEHRENVVNEMNAQMPVGYMVEDDSN